MNFDFRVMDATEKRIFSLRSLYLKHGYTRYKMGKFEEYDLYSRNKDFLVSDRVITFTDVGGKLLALKPDVTLSIIKNNQDVPGTVNKLCYNENIYRVAKGSDSFREIMQTGVECFGDIATDDICEVLQMALESLRECSDSFALTVSDLGILTAFLEAVTDDKNVQPLLLKCIDEKNTHEILEVCKKYGIDSAMAESLIALLGLHGPYREVLPQLKALCEKTPNLSDYQPLEDAMKAFADCADADKVLIDFSVVGDTNYYNGIIFKGFIDTIPGSVLSGGQYDRLMHKLGRRSQAIGFAVYLDMLDRIEVK